MPTPAGPRGRRRRSRRRATASTSTTSTSSATAGRSSGSRTASPRTTCTRPARSCAASGKQIGAKDKAYKPVWKFAPDAPLDARPYGGTITVKYPYNTISYKYDRKTNTYLRSVTGEKKQTDAGTETRIAPKNVVVMRMRFGPLNDGHPGAPRLEATRRRQRAGLDLDQRPDDQGHVEEDGDHEADAVLRRGRATRSR